MFTRQVHRVGRHRYAMLLAVMAVSLLLQVIGQHFGHGRAEYAARFILIVALMIALGSAYLAVWKEHRHLAAVGIALMVCAAVTGLVQSITENPGGLALSQGAAAAALSYFVLLISRYFFTTTSADSEMISAAICVYLMLGMIWAALYIVAEVLTPGSFSIHGEVTGQTGAIGDPRSGLATYYSFVTLTTLGYGEIVPLTPVTRMLAGTQAVLGPLYLAIVVARLVGVQIAGRRV